MRVTVRDSIRATIRVMCGFSEGLIKVLYRFKMLFVEGRLLLRVFRMGSSGLSQS